MMKKVIRTTPTPNGTLLEYADGSREELIGVSASLNSMEDKESEDEEEDEDDQESMMSELKSQRQI